MPLGSFKLRIVAFVLDIFLVYHIILGTLTYFIVDSAFFRYSKQEIIISTLIALLFPLYKIIAEWKYGYTIGKKIIGLRVVNQEFKPIELKAAAIKNGYLLLYFLIPCAFFLISYKFFFKHHSGTEYIDMAFSTVEMIFKGFIFLIIYLAYNLLWILIMFLTSISAVDSNKKQTLFDKLSKTLTVVS